ncbi:shikimate dehydrogenase [Alterisphingorhabdus coralli]|uniref:Shikimate dehydrogenase (NADP(+)) n=1 Tax=Alterisphingorhabdus coralli TaxID=3071408 RepID=A0AA97F8Y0_9SPHN|nr:shikimate dehydrogenase [Parasphingorhabdus sp. SCSIO 66989]WOE75457.1 shikimate dehydrogenase [Parasphingorhabdus sp. SCSIO 66989]
MSFDTRFDRPTAEVIGDPISHSKSPLIHRFWLEQLGLNGDYQACHVAPDLLADYFAARRSDPNWRGCNVTIPHKLAVLDHAEDRGGVKQSIGAANTVFREDGKDSLIATNTDAAGFYAPLSQSDLSGRSALVIGAGGAARAVLFALARAEIGTVALMARNPLKAMALLSGLGVKGEVIGFDAPLPAADLLINASPLGMTGFDPLPDLDLGRLPNHAIVYDLVYAPLETELLSVAKARGLETIDGLSMLIGQAALAFELFFGAAVPADSEQQLREKLIA